MKKHWLKFICTTVFLILMIGLIMVNFLSYLVQNGKAEKEILVKITMLPTEAMLSLLSSLHTHYVLLDIMYYKELAKKVDYLKNTEEGVRTLCKVMEDMRNETAENMKIEIAQRLISQGKLAIEDIASAATLTVEKVTELAREKKSLIK